MDQFLKDVLEIHCDCYVQETEFLDEQSIVTMKAPKLTYPFRGSGFYKTDFHTDDWDSMIGHPKALEKIAKAFLDDIWADSEFIETESLKRRSEQ